MKIFEILVEDIVNRELEDLNDILTSAKAHGITNIPTNTIVNTLRGMGHNVNNNSILVLLKDIPFVNNATPDRIMLMVDDLSSVSGEGSEDMGADAIEKMALQTAEKDIKQRQS